MMSTVHHYMLADWMASLSAIALYPLFVIFPGYAAAWWFDLFTFRRRTLVFRIALSVPLSIAICPILTYLAGYSFGKAGIWTLYAVLWFGCLAAVAQDWRGRTSSWAGAYRWRVFAGIAVAWLVIVLFSLADLQIGNRVYYSITALDYSLRTGLIQSISTTGIPPANPYFFSGRLFPLQYHYLWFILCSLVQQTGGAAVGPRAALTGGVFWSGIALMGLVALYLRVFSFRGQEGFRRRVLIGILLLGVTGLDLIPTVFLRFLNIVLASMDWWNEQVNGFVSTALWEPHHLSGLIACLTAFLILWEIPNQVTWRARIQYAVTGALALATGVGSSIYVTLVFAVFLLIWTAITIGKKWGVETAGLGIAGTLAIVFALPYLKGMLHPGAGAGFGPPFQFRIRTFKLAEMYLEARGLNQLWRLSLVNLLFLPLNYLLELGFFFVAARIWWKARQSAGRPFTRAEMALAVMAATGILSCTFVRSSLISNNDLGWRGFLVAQFALLLCAVDVVTASDFAGVRPRKLLAVMLALGAAGTLYDLTMLRAYPILADQRAVSMIAWLSPDYQLGARTYAMREAYEWATRSTPARATVQFNPHVALENVTGFLYSNRQMVAADPSCLAGFGGDPAVCAKMLAKLDELYPAKGKPAAQSIASACDSLPINILGANDTDSAWADRHSWVWSEKPVFANSYVRLFGCRDSTVHAAGLRSGL